MVKIVDVDGYVNVSCSQVTLTFSLSNGKNESVTLDPEMWLKLVSEVDEIKAYIRGRG